MNGENCLRFQSEDIVVFYGRSPALLPPSRGGRRALERRVFSTGYDFRVNGRITHGHVRWIGPFCYTRSDYANHQYWTDELVHRCMRNKFCCDHSHFPLLNWHSNVFSSPTRCAECNQDDLHKFYCDRSWTLRAECRVKWKYLLLNTSAMTIKTLDDWVNFTGSRRWNFCYWEIRNWFTVIWNASIRMQNHLAFIPSIRFSTGPSTHCDEICRNFFLNIGGRRTIFRPFSRWQIWNADHSPAMTKTQRQNYTVI